MASPRTRICLLTACLVNALPAMGAALGPAPGSAAIARASAMPVVVFDDSPTASSDSDGEALYLEVVLNGTASGKVVHFVRTGDAFLADASTLRRIGINLPADLRGTVDLAGIAGMGVRYDEAAQRIEVTTPPGFTNQPVTRLNIDVPQSAPHATASPGILLNYDLYAAQGVSLYTEMRAFNQWGVVSTTALTRSSSGIGGGGTLRMDTTFSRSWPTRALTLRAGDITTGSTSWSRPTRLGGIQLQSNFALEPGFVAFPIPAFFGRASLPSAVDLYVNGIKQYSSDVPAGPFQIDTMPIVAGSGEATVVVTDALGRESAMAFPFYTTDRLLKPGLNDYSVDVGFVRRDYGLRSFAYGSDLAASGTWRRGVLPWLTIDGHVETMAGLRLGGVGAVARVGRGGVVSASVAASDGTAGSGRQVQAGYDWRGARLNLTFDTTRTIGEYRDLASSYGVAPPEQTTRVLAGFMLGRAGSVGGGLVTLKYPAQPSARYASGYYYVSLGAGVSLNASVNRDLGGEHDTSAYLGLAIPIGTAATASTSVRHSRNGNEATVDAGRPISPDGGIGWHVHASDGSELRNGLAEVGYNGRYGQVRGGVSVAGARADTYIDFSGSLVAMDRQVLAGRRIDDAFAVVSTDGIADVPVALENRPIGTTNARGALLVPSLNAYQSNKISIDTMRLPAGVAISRVDAEAVPSDHAGAVIEFGIRDPHAATVLLRDAEGKSIRAGSTATLAGDADSTVVGYDGAVYLEGLSGNEVLKVSTPDGDCVAEFEYHHKSPAAPVIGPLTCYKESSR